MTSDPNTLTLAVRPAPYTGPWAAYTGWQDVRVTRGIERCPSDFEVGATARFPGLPNQVNVQRGWQCQVRLGDDLVLTGYVDQVLPSLAPNAHTIRIRGRSKSEDLVDCSAEFSTFQLNNTDALALARKLAAPFGIGVSALGDIGATQIPQFDVILSETPFEIIERVARYAALLAYDDVDGNFLLSRTGASRMASGFAEGRNVQAAEAAFALDQRYSVVSTVLLSTGTLFTGPGGQTAPEALAQQILPGAQAVDPGVPRYRPLVLIAEQNDQGYAVSRQRAQWEVARRAGRSDVVRLTADGWRDADGALWQVNALAPLDLPTLGLAGVTWLISEVTFRRGEDGTCADLVLMPPEAFRPQPIVLQPFAPQVNQALYGNGGAAPSGGVRIDLGLPSLGGAAP